METKVIRLNDYLTLNSGITPEEGIPVFETIVQAFKEGCNVTLDFSDVTMLTTAFLNVVIGDLYEDYTSEDLKNRLALVNYSASTAARIKKVTDNAKLFYKDKEAYSKDVEEALNGIN
jgi:hypothetical protein